MTEYQIILIIESATAQIVILIGQIIAINFAMMVAIYYFLNKAGWAIKIAAFILYTLGSSMFLLLAVREAIIAAAGGDALEEQEADTLSPVAQAMLAHGESPNALMLTILINTSIWAMWLGVFYLLFFWKRGERDKE